jgi:lysophospholipase L1-like esterase
MKRTFILLQIFIGVAIVAGGLEVLLRLYPAAIPLALLQHFQQDLRLRVASRLDLPNRYDFLEVSRDDGGPLLRRYRPDAQLTSIGRDRDAVETVVMDEAGFCNPDRSRAATDPVEILAVGDSFTWCTAVAPGEAWPAQLENVAARPTYNLGVAGVGPYEYVQILKRFGAERRPRVVIMNVYEGNDLRDALRYWDHRNRASDAAEATDPDDRRGGWLSRHSYVVNLATAAWREWIGSAWRSLTEVEPEFKKGLDAIDKESLDLRYVLHLAGGDTAFNRENSDRDELRLAMVLDQGLIDLSVFDDALATFADLAGEQGFVPVLAYSPSAHTAYANYVEFSDPSAGPVLARYSERLRGYFRDAAERYGLHFVDLTEFLRAEIDAQGDAQAERLLYFPFNVHFTPEGHRIVARGLAESLETLPQIE